jgi:hypothetical protein
VRVAAGDGNGEDPRDGGEERAAGHRGRSCSLLPQEVVGAQEQAHLPRLRCATGSPAAEAWTRSRGG